MREDQSQKKMEEIRALAEEVMQLARDSVTVRFRFFDSALARLRLEWVPGLMGADLVKEADLVRIDPVWLLKACQEEPAFPFRLLMHSLLHLIFLHPFQTLKLKRREWDLACDLAVEHIVMEICPESSGLSSDSDKKSAIEIFSARGLNLTADGLYREFLTNRLSDLEYRKLSRLFLLDRHDAWYAEPKTGRPAEMTVSEEDWKNITRRIRAELKSFSQNQSGSESFEKNMDFALKERYNYREILENFLVAGEEIGLSDEEFDYVYYTYGLSVYGNMPLIEPLEYKDTKKVREIVIAIDTSASCRGETVRQFVRKTYQILKDSETFFQKINIHIIQCDAQIRSDVVVTSQEDFEDFLEHGRILGFGSTDFRPVFEYVDTLIEKGTFENLAGLIYFTDGYGIYPEQMPPYEVIFAFLNEDENRMPVPPWAVKVVLNEDMRV